MLVLNGSVWRSDPRLPALIMSVIAARPFLFLHSIALSCVCVFIGGDGPIPRGDLF